MSGWIAGAMVVSSIGGAVMASKSADDAADASKDAAATQAGSEREALDYLKEVERLPQQFREGALMKLGGIAGLEGGEGDQQELIDKARQSPLYSAIMGTQGAGEDAIMRNASMTGGLRSGNTQDQLFSYNANLENTALLESYNQELQGLQGLGQLPSNANTIASATSNIGATLAQGQIGAANAKQQGNEAMMNSLMGGAQLGLSAYSAGMFSDRRLKKNITLLGRIGRFNWYSWDWNSVGEHIGLKGKTQGVIADEVVDIYPEAVTLRQGFMFVNYGKLEA